jgi:hypothetical protein
VSDTLTTTLDTAYALGGVEVTVTPISGSGPVDCTAILRPEADEVAELFLVGSRVAGYRIRLRSDAVVRPREGDVIAASTEGLLLKVTHTETAPATAEWFVTATPIFVPTTVTEADIGHLQPPLFGGWAWA